MANVNHILLYTISGAAISYFAYKHQIDKKAEANSFVGKKLIVDKKINKEAKQKQLNFISIWDKDNYVYKLKKIINYFYSEKIFEEDDVYDDFLLEVVQDLFKGSPALIDYSNGMFCTNFIDVTDYILKKGQGEYVEEYMFNFEDIDTDSCEYVEKGDRGYKVVQLQRIINELTCFETLKENGKYSANMRNVVRDVFGGTNVIKDDASAGVCYRYIVSLYTLLNNINENLQEIKENEEGEGDAK